MYILCYLYQKTLSQTKTIELEQEWYFGHSITELFIVGHSVHGRRRAQDRSEIVVDEYKQRASDLKSGGRNADISSKDYDSVKRRRLNFGPPATDTEANQLKTGYSLRSSSGPNSGKGKTYFDPAHPGNFRQALGGH